MHILLDLVKVRRDICCPFNIPDLGHSWAPFPYVLAKERIRLHSKEDDLINTIVYNAEAYISFKIGKSVESERHVLTEK